MKPFAWFIVFILLFTNIGIIWSYRIGGINSNISNRVIKLISRKCKLYSVPEWLISSPSSSSTSLSERENEEKRKKETESLDPSTEKITVRFINTIDGKDVITHVHPGDNLLQVGDKAGVKLPRACRTGLCGSCTCEVQDPNAIATSSNLRDGFATIRACSVKCFVPQGMEEMVVDVYRMKKTANASARREVGATIVEKEEYTDPMARFSGDWEKEFRPQWELGSSINSVGKGQVGAASDPKSKLNICQKCQGSSRVVCYNCHGSGMIAENQCFICVGMRTVGCGYCRGTGKRNFKS